MQGKGADEVVKVIGVRLHTDRLKRMSGARTKSTLNKALYAAGQVIEIEAERSITAGSVSGAGHVPSAPGEPPNADTRLLDTSIHTVAVGDGRVNVESTAPYAAALEFGTSRMAARPYMLPAAVKKRPEAQSIISEAVRRSTK